MFGKKGIFCLVLVFLLLGLITSCSDPNNLTDNETITIMYPEFMESEAKNGTKGLSNMTDATQNSPFDDTGVAQGIMSTMPCMTGIKPIVIKKSQLVSSLTDTFKGTVYPFGFKCIRKMIKPNVDGIYCYYDIYDDDQWVGFFDYYYNWTTKRFSYKEIANVTVSPAETIMIFIEYNDVPIDGFDTANPKFAVGQLKDDGTFEKNATLTQITLKSYVAYLQSFYVTAKSDGQIFASFFRPDESIESGYNKDAFSSDKDPNLKPLQSKYEAWVEAHPNGLTPQVGNSKDFLMEDFFSVLGTALLSNIDEIQGKISKGKTGLLESGYYPEGYSTYDEYLGLSLHVGQIETYKDAVETKRTNLVHDNASVLNFITKQTASVQFSYKLYHSSIMEQHDRATCTYCKNHKNMGGAPTLINVSNDKAEVESIKALDLTVAPYNQYGLMGCKAPYEMFNAIYKLDTPLLETDGPDHDEKLMAFKNTLATEHMKACGLPADKAKNYAENLIYTEKEIEDNPSQRHYIRLTTEPFETFKVKFDEAQGQEN